MRKLFISSMAFMAFLLLVIGCGGGGLSPMPPTEGNIYGTIKNFSTGNNLDGVTVILGDKNVTTDSKGSFSFQKVDLNGRMPLIIEKNGFAKTGKIVNLTTKSAEIYLNVKLLPVAYSGTFDPTAKYTIVAGVAGISYISIEENTLFDKEGNLPIGEVRYEVTPISPASMGISVMPGDMMLSNGKHIATYGAMTVLFTDSRGNVLNLASGHTASVGIAVSSKSTEIPPATAKLYNYNETEGVWEEGESALLSTNKNSYKGKVSHFSTWNIGYEYETVMAKGCIQNLIGERVSSALVTMEGFTYNGTASVYTNLNGDFTLPVMKNEISLITASRKNESSNTAKVEKPNADVTLTDCIILGDIPIIARLTWGQRPSDLDTHVVGPNDYHIWYPHKGDLNKDEYAKLDVDDVTSYGPEVFTALSFPTAGIYHYAIYNYSGTHSPNITTSPAKVEVSVNGETTVFTPPPGEISSHMWWNVFDIIVDSRGKVRMTPINTWASEGGGPASGRSGRLTKILMPSKD
jgi:hypothetical protein